MANAQDFGEVDVPLESCAIQVSSFVLGNLDHGIQEIVLVKNTPQHDVDGMAFQDQHAQFAGNAFLVKADACESDTQNPVERKAHVDNENYPN